MIGLVSIQRVVVLVAVFYSVAVAIIVSLLGSGNDVFEHILWSFKAAFLLNLLILILVHLVWRKLWKVFPILNNILFPDLNGNWSMKIHWSYEGNSDTVSARAEIKQTLFSISMSVSSDGSDSDTLLVVPKKELESSGVLLYYVYRVIPKHKNGKSDSAYNGTSILRIKSKNFDRLEGNYYTDKSTKGYYTLIRE
ncbi:hypothetical protein [Cobetia sp. MB87]|uniref:Cap15 family cyclic dinucleotide receptor domain-containing protein n=1 Tax=Cobetia sp. MB87 TaxID=2588451 RepID=UPI001409B64B|nr:hypothetical protein [Cobetia sp. MB87]NHH85715.1 hypothetical protein [Cobetia sp. MB87]